MFSKISKSLLVFSFTLLSILIWAIVTAGDKKESTQSNLPDIVN